MTLNPSGTNDRATKEKSSLVKLRQAPP